MNLSVQAIDNIWRHWWAGHMRAVGGVSRLNLEPLDPSILRHEEEPPNRQARRALQRISRSALKPRRTPHRTTDQSELAEWARRVIGDERISDIHLTDVLDGLNEYFSVFGKLKRVDPANYEYFARAGTPIATRNSNIYKRDFDCVKIPSADKLPSVFGTFFVRSRDEYRDDIMNDKPSFLDFEYFEKLTHAFPTAAPRGTVIYRHNLVSIGHDSWFTKEERSRYPCVRGTWNVWWLVGILPDGTIRALPCKMSQRQTLPDGEVLYHHGLMIPPGLKHNDIGAHEFVRRLFLGTLTFAATALSGVQVTVRRNGLALRIGLPISVIKEFFSDRVKQGRRQILHLRRAHTRRTANGGEVAVGEHLRGERFFQWRDYEISLGVEGIHYPAIESFTGALHTEADSDFAELEETGDLIDSGEMVEMMQAKFPGRKPVPIRRGKPTIEYELAHMGGQP